MDNFCQFRQLNSSTRKALHFSNIAKNWQTVAKIGDFANFAKIAYVHPSGVNTNLTKLAKDRQNR